MGGLSTFEHSAYTEGGRERGKRFNLHSWAGLAKFLGDRVQKYSKYVFSTVIFEGTNSLMTIDASTFQEYGLPTWLNLMYSSSSRSGPGGRGGGFRRAKTRDLVRSLYPRDWSTCRNTFVAKRGGDDAFFFLFFSNASFFLSIVSVYKRNDRIVCYPGKNECKLIILRGSISVRNSSWKFFSLLSPAEILDSVRREIKISRRFFPFLNSFRIFENGWKIIQDEYVYSRRNIGSWNNVWNVATFFRPRCIRFVYP